MKNDSKIANRLRQINNVVDEKAILGVRTGESYIKKYYHKNKYAYSFLHNGSGFMHLAISKDGIYKKEDLLESVKIVDASIRRTRAKTILELASGRGANSAYLAQKNPKSVFYSIEFSKTQLDYAHKKSRKIRNYKPLNGNYHHLETFKTGSIDVVFIIEALCHSTNKEKVLKEVSRVLKNNGLFIIIDGYSNEGTRKLTKNQKKALELAGKAMAVEKFEPYAIFRKMAKRRFKIINEKNLSRYILPNVYRFERMARLFFKSKGIATIIARIVPKEVTYNAIAGYLLPVLLKEQACIYMITVLQNNTATFK